MPDLSKLSINELQSLQEQISTEITGRRNAEKTKAQKEILDLANRYGLAVQFAAGANKAPKAKGTVAAKYKHPQNPSLTWTGRGRSPVWVTEWKTQHGSLADITI